MTLAPEGLENPLLEGLGIARTPESCAVVIFGASGDLTHETLPRPLLARASGTSCRATSPCSASLRTEGSDEEFREDMKSASRSTGAIPSGGHLGRSPRECATWTWTSATTPAGTRSSAADRPNMGTGGNRVYFAVPAQSGRSSRRSASAAPERVEPPGHREAFGNDLSSARELNGLIAKEFDESEVFRIDHYLGKETVQNMLALRFANGSSSRSGTASSSTTCTDHGCVESRIENRAGYYESAGVIRDVFQNHLLQLVALAAMEPPISTSAEAVRNEKVGAALHTPGPKHIVRGQYGRWIDGGRSPPTARRGRRARFDHRHVHRRQALRGQLALGGHAVLRARGENGSTWRRRSRSVPARHTAVRGDRGWGLRPNVLVVHVQPDEGVSLSIARRSTGQG